GPHAEPFRSPRGHRRHRPDTPPRRARPAGGRVRSRRAASARAAPAGGAAAPAARTPPCLDILGVPVLAASADAAIALIDSRCAAGAPVGVAFLNAHGSNLAARDPAFAEALRGMLVLN